MIHFNCATYGTWHGPSSCSEYRRRGGAKLVENEFGNIMRGERVRKSVNFPPPPSPENWFAGTARGTKKIQFKDSSSSSPHADPTRPAAAFSGGGGRRGKRRCVIHFPPSFPSTLDLTSWGNKARTTLSHKRGTKKHFFASPTAATVSFSFLIQAPSSRRSEFRPLRDKGGVGGGLFFHES